jgi:hypothetical protein
LLGAAPECNPRTAIQGLLASFNARRCQPAGCAPK